MHAEARPRWAGLEEAESGGGKRRCSAERCNLDLMRLSSAVVGARLLSSAG